MVSNHIDARAVVCIATLGVTTGCLPLPVATPPLRASGVFGGGSDGVAGGPGAVRPRGTGRLAVTPLGLPPSMSDRVVDPEIGLLLEGILGADAGDDPDYGYYLGLAWHFWQYQVPDAGGRHRAYVRGTADLVTQTPRKVLGGGASVAVGWEYVGFADRAGFQTNVGLPAYVGFAFGEGSGGFELVASWRDFEGENAWQLAAGITVRLPASAGFVLVPLFPSSSDP